jgi:iron complex outermembrane receptor protein
MRTSIFLSIILIWVIHPFAFTQDKKNCDYVIRGMVYDAVTKAPLPFATVQIEGSDRGTAADENGRFEIAALCEKEYDLIFSSVGYKTAVHHHDFHHPEMEVYLAPDEVLLESVTVEAEYSQTGMSSSTSNALSEKEMARVQSESLGDMASQIAGVHTISTGQNIVKPVIHGLHGYRILIINNGLRHEFQNWGTDHAPEIDPSLFDHIEVLKGAATVRYGPDALGGVILINPPKMRLSTPLKGEVQLTGKTNGRSGEGTVRLRKGFRWLSLMSEASWLKQGDLRAPDYLLTNTGKEEWSSAGGLLIHPLPELDIEAYYSHFAQGLGILRGAVNGNLDDLLQAFRSDVPNFTQPFGYDISPPKQRVTHDLFKAKARYIGSNQSLTVQYGWQFNRRREYDVRRGNDKEIPNIDLELRTQNVDVDWQHPSLGDLSGKIGFQWLTQYNENLPGTNTIPFVPNYKSKRYGVYLIETYESGDNLFEAGLRYDYQHANIAGRHSNNEVYRNSITYENVTATVGYKRHLGPYGSFRSNFGTAWRPPNVAELYRLGRHLTSLEYGLWRYRFTEQDFISSREILTQEDKPVSPELGFKWINTYEIRLPKFRAEVTGYANFIQNFIYARPGGLTSTVRGTMPFFLYDQTDALLWGIDFDGVLDHTDKFSSSVKASYLWSKQIEEDDFFAGQPPTQIGYDLSFFPDIEPMDGTEVQLRLTYTFKQYQRPRVISVEELLNAKEQGIDLFQNDASDFDIVDSPPGYFLTDLAWMGSMGSLQWNAQVRNLFNVRYRNYTDRLRYFADGQGINFILSLTYRW